MPIGSFSFHQSFLHCLPFEETLPSLAACIGSNSSKKERKKSIIADFLKIILPLQKVSVQNVFHKNYLYGMVFQ